MDKRLPEISKRLKCIVSMVTPGQTIADIGCDHGYTSIWLRNSGVCLHCIASDINEGPLERAKANALLYDTDDIDFRLGPGLKTVDAGEADCAVITGMGGLLIVNILKADPDIVRCLKELVLSPQSDVDAVRKYLEESGFSITDEAFVFEDGKYYPIIKALNLPSDEKMSEAELLFGPVLLKRRDEVLMAYLEKRRRALKTILENIKDNGSEAAISRGDEINNELLLIDAALSKT